MKQKMFVLILGGLFLIGNAGYSFAQAVNEEVAPAVMGMPDEAMDESEDFIDQTENVADLMEDLNAVDENMILEDENLPQALAIIEGTSPDSEIYGEVELTDTEEGLMINIEIYNAPAGLHGIHVHENGSCEDSGNAAGGHFNPEAMQHGELLKDGPMKAHLGDMGNIDINEEGEGTLSLVLPGVTLAEGKNSISGKAIILHEKADDFGQPTGNAGGRIGCGLIESLLEE